MLGLARESGDMARVGGAAGMSAIIRVMPPRPMADIRQAVADGFPLGSPDYTLVAAVAIRDRLQLLELADELLAALREIADGRVMRVKDIADTAAWRLAEVVVEYQRIASEAIARAETP